MNFKSILLVTMLGASPTVALSDDIPPDNVTFIATINNGPAMRPCSWKVNGVEITNRHSLTTYYPPGTYTVSVSCTPSKGIEKINTFTVPDDDPVLVVVPVD